MSQARELRRQTRRTEALAAYTHAHHALGYCLGRPAHAGGAGEGGPREAGWGGGGSAGAYQSDWHRGVDVAEHVQPSQSLCRALGEA
jgi:hypothetical protein